MRREQNMKNLFLLLFIGFFGTIGSTQAKPLLYRFEGYITESWDTAGSSVMVLLQMYGLQCITLIRKMSFESARLNITIR